MSDETEANDVRRRVLDTVAPMAHRVIESVEQGGLTAGHIDDRVEVAGVTWNVSAIYWQATGFVRIVGAPVVDETHGVHPFMLIFQTDPADDGSFTINLPKDWLPSLIPVDTSALTNARG